MKTKGQISWVWALLSTGVGLLITTFMFILLDDARSNIVASVLVAGTDPDRLALLNSFFSIAPIAILAGWAIFIIIVGILTRGGESYGQ